MTEKKPKWAPKRQIPKKLIKREKRLLRPASGWELGLQWGAGDRSRVSGGVICLSGSGLTVTVQPSAVSRLG